MLLKKFSSICDKILTEAKENELEGPGSFAMQIFGKNDNILPGIGIGYLGFKAFDSFKRSNKLGMLCIFLPNADDGHITSNGRIAKNKYLSFKTYLDAFKDNDEKLQEKLKEFGLTGDEYLKNVRSPSGETIPVMSLLEFAEKNSNIF